MDKTLTPTGRTFTGTIEDNTGRFQAKGNLAHAIVELSADGYYFNEVSGSLSAGKLTLQAMSDLTESRSVNVNLMTHMERKRVEDILESGYPYVSAKGIAQNDILKIFNIEDVKIGNSESLDISQSGTGNEYFLPYLQSCRVIDLRHSSQNFSQRSTLIYAMTERLM